MFTQTCVSTENNAYTYILTNSPISNKVFSAKETTSGKCFIFSLFLLKGKDGFLKKKKKKKIK